MLDQQERTTTPTDEVVHTETWDAATPGVETSSDPSHLPVMEETPPATVEAEVAKRPDVPFIEGNGVEVEGRHARAGRKGAHRVHQLIQEGRLYEQEHGLKSGRQRLRQLIELGKLYEQDHGLRPTRPNTRGQRLSRTDREELVSTLLHCLLRMVKPSFRPELARLVQALEETTDGHAA